MKKMQDTFKSLLCSAIVLLCASCAIRTQDGISVKVENTLSLERREIVAVPRKKIEKLLKSRTENCLRVKDVRSGEYLPCQWIDYNQDSVPEELLFMAAVPAKATSDYKIIADSTIAQPEIQDVAFSRFVPERADDYTWENDRVAFRVYGPAGQREAREAVPGSTLSSGVDIWLKRTGKAVINRWYAGHVKTPGYYHIDHGEGYDPYHVGVSRGTGGSGLWEQDTLYVSENYVRYRTIATGPLRTVFELEYQPWSPYGVTETKRVSLDIGSNFSKFEVGISSYKAIPNYTIGITLHKGEGTTALNPEQGWFRHWEKIDDAFIGEGIVLDPAAIDTAFVHHSTVPDQGNLLILTKPKNKITYYAGFAWEKSGQVNTLPDWEAILRQQALILQHPLHVTVE